MFVGDYFQPWIDTHLEMGSIWHASQNKVQRVYSWQ